MYRKQAPQLLAVALAACVVLAAAPTSSQAAGCPDANVQAIPGLISLPRIESSILCLLNNERTSRGLAAVSSNGDLAQAAQGHSSSMRWNSFFSHDSFDGSPFENRIIATGYVSGAGKWLLGENIGWGSLILSTPKSLVTAWMNSPPHRENILDGEFREIGVGTDWGSPLDPWAATAVIATTDFGTVEAAQATASKKKKKRKKKRHRRKRRKR